MVSIPSISSIPLQSRSNEVLFTLLCEYSDNTDSDNLWNTVFDNWKTEVIDMCIYFINLCQTETDELLVRTICNWNTQISYEDRRNFIDYTVELTNLKIRNEVTAWYHMIRDIEVKIKYRRKYIRICKRCCCCLYKYFIL